MITTSAPGKVILFGEHAVVYDKLGIACTFDKRCRVSTSLQKENVVSIHCKKSNHNKSMNQKDLFYFLKEVRGLIEKKKFKKINDIAESNYLAPSFFVVGNILAKHGFKGLKIEVESEIPKNLGSSAAVFSAISLSVLKALDKKISKEEVSDFAYSGEIIAHGGTPSGIDNSIVTYGGYLQYQKSEGIKMLDVDFKIPLLIVDSGEESQTGKMVSFVREKKEKYSETVNFILEELDDFAERGLNSLRNKNLSNIGKLMNEYYWELKKLEISTDKLDQIVDIALSNGALGAKPTGGWGGGCCLVLAENDAKLKKIRSVFTKKGFKSYIGDIGVEGVKIV